MKNYLVLISLLFFLSSCLFFNNNSTKLYRKAMKEAPYDAGIIPGVPWVENGWDSTMKGRVMWAVHLYKKGVVKNLIFSGGAVYSPYYEGKIMCLYAQEMGVPAQHCIPEIEAEHSVENVYYGKKIADSLGLKKVALLTDPFQSTMLKGLLRKYSPRIARIPFLSDTLKSINKINPKIDGSTAKSDNYTLPLWDRETKFQRLQGTRGKKVKSMMRADKRAKNKNQN